MYVCTTQNQCDVLVYEYTYEYIFVFLEWNLQTNVQ